MLTACAGGTEHLHLIVLRTDFHILRIVFDVRNDFNGGEGGLTAGIGIKGRHTNQAVDTVLSLQEAISILAFNEDVGGFQSRLVAFLIVHDLIGKAVALRPAGIHPVEHLRPILRLGTAGTGVEAHKSIVLIVVTGEQGFQTAGLHFLSQSLIPFLQLLQHGIVVLFLCHFADGHQVIPRSQHLLIPLNLILRLPGFYHNLLAFLRVVPETGGFLHGMEPLQLTAQPFHIQRIRQTFQCRAAVVQFLLIRIKFNIHSHTLSFRQFTES